MGKLRIPFESWVLICDGQKALLLQNRGDAEHLDLHPIEVLAEAHPKTSELGTDAPGRSFQSYAPARSSVETTDLHAQEEEEFLRKLAQSVDAAASAHKVKHLVLVAPPKALGILRTALTPAARELVIDEIHKDLTHLPIGTIEAHLNDAEAN